MIRPFTMNIMVCKSLSWNCCIAIQGFVENISDCVIISNVVKGKIKLDIGIKV